MKKLKGSGNIYRTIKGIRYIQETSNPADFEKCKRECKEAGIKYRIINAEFLKQTIQ